MLDGQRVSHTIDPRTGRPVMHSLASASVIDPLCVRADAIATALMVLGPDDGYALAVEQGWPALFIVRAPDGTFEERATSAWATFPNDACASLDLVDTGPSAGTPQVTARVIERREHHP